jgi:hypothetical protein
LPNAFSAVIRVDARRQQSQCRSRSHAPSGGADVADDLALGAEGEQRERRKPIRAGAQLIEQVSRRDGREQRPDSIGVGWKLTSNDHGVCASGDAAEETVIPR